MRVLTHEELSKLAELDRKKLRPLIYFIGGALDHGVENNQSSAKTIVERIRTVIED